VWDAEATARKRWLVMLRAFFDESGTDPNGPAFIMGGFLSKAEEWDKAADAWDECLKESPTINAFHHAEAHGLYGNFGGWRRDDADAKVLRLAKTIAMFDLQGFVTALSHSWFVPRDKRASKGMFGSRIYDHAFLKIVSGVTAYVERTVSGDDKVDFIFERRPELRQCIPVYEELKNVIKPEWIGRAGSCIPDDDENSVALQMADLLSWEFLQVTDRNHQSEPFQAINRARQIFYLPCTPPRWFPYSLAVHRFGQSVKDVSDQLQKRIYGDKEKSLELLQDVQKLILDKAEFDGHFRSLCGLTENVELFSEYLHECEDARKRSDKG
jgi:hypothetical protein